MRHLPRAGPLRPEAADSRPILPSRGIAGPATRFQKDQCLVSELSDADLESLSGGVGGLNTQCRPGGGSNLGGSCFAAGTPVLMADGAWRPIEQVTVGSAVLSYDENLGRVTANPVTKVLHHAAEPIHRAVVEGVGRDLLLTTNHHVYSAGRFCAIRDLPPGAELFNFDLAQGEAPRRLLGLEPTDRSEPVYNFEVESAHTYFVGGVRVRNSSIGGRK